MLRGLPIIAVACLSALVLVGCSRRIEPPPARTSVIPEAEKEYVVEHSKKRESEKKKDQEEDQEKSPAVSLKDANETCRKESRIKGIRNLVVIFRQRSRERAYAKCMQRKGFNVAE